MPADRPHTFPPVPKATARESATATGASPATCASPAPRATAAPNARTSSAPAPNGPAPNRSERERRALLALVTGDAHEVLERIVDGDPLDLAARIARRAAERALVLPPAELFARAAAHCARAARDYRGRPRVDLWVERRLDEVLHVDDGFASGASANAGPNVAGGSHRDLDRAARDFNACARRDRDALWRLAFSGAKLDDLAHERGTGLVEVARGARRALDALLANSKEVSVR